MLISAIETELVTPRSASLIELLIKHLPPLKEGTVVAITSKIISLCEGRVVPMGSVSKESLIEQESQLYTDPLGKHGFQFTITNETFLLAAGIDESNGGDNFVLWPDDVQGTANEVWHQLKQHYGLQSLGIIVTDSTCRPLRRGATGISLAHCGFSALKDYVGQPDLFDRPFKVSQANIAEGLAAAAVLVMGEGTEQTPLCIINDIDPIDFSDKPPSAEELQSVYVAVEEDIFAPLIETLSWRQGGKGAENGRRA